MHLVELDDRLPEVAACLQGHIDEAISQRHVGLDRTREVSAIVCIVGRVGEGVEYALEREHPVLHGHKIWGVLHGREPFVLARGDAPWR